MSAEKDPKSGHLPALTYKVKKYNVKNSTSAEVDVDEPAMTEAAAIAIYVDSLATKVRIRSNVLLLERASLNAIDWLASVSTGGGRAGRLGAGDCAELQVRGNDLVEELSAGNNYAAPESGSPRSGQRL